MNAGIALTVGHVEISLPAKQDARPAQPRASGRPPALVEVGLHPSSSLLSSPEWSPPLPRDAVALSLLSPRTERLTRCPITVSTISMCPRPTRLEPRPSILTQPNTAPPACRRWHLPWAGPIGTPSRTPTRRWLPMCSVSAVRPQRKVRRTLAFSVHEPAVILGNQLTAADRVPIFNGFLKDLDAVRTGVLRHLCAFLKVGRRIESNRLPASAPLFKPLHM